MDSFVALDFETANGRRTSVCSVGMVLVEGGEMVDRFYSLIRPYPNYYLPFNTAIHGLTGDDTDSAEHFDQVWPRMRAFIGGRQLVAHNKSFDEGCLRALLAHYGFNDRVEEFLCTRWGSYHAVPGLANYKLDTVAAYFGYNLKAHHHALADAEACAYIGIRLFATVPRDNEC